MIPRRSLLLCAGLLPFGAAFARRASIVLSGSLEQGSLVRGRVGPGAALTLDGKALRPTADGHFAFGLPYNSTKTRKLSAVFADGRTETRTVVPAARHYRIQRINGLERKYVKPDPDLVARINRENAAIIAARAVDSDLSGFETPFDWPAHGVISGAFGSQRILDGVPKRPHFGVDVAAPVGAPITAPADGKVMLTQTGYFLTGGTTVIDHGHGVSTTYFHQSALLVKAGQMVRRGDPIGKVGKTGRATGPHLHWAMNWFALRLDPSRATRTKVPPRR